MLTAIADCSDAAEGIGDLNDINYQIIVAKREAAEKLCVLSELLYARYLNDSAIEDIRAALECDKKALDLTPADEPLLAAQRHNSIGVELLAIYRFEGGLELLNQSVIHSLQAIKGTPYTDATRQEWREHRYNLAISLHDQYHGTKNEEDLMGSLLG